MFSCAIAHFLDIVRKVLCLEGVEAGFLSLSTNLEDKEMRTAAGTHYKGQQELLLHYNTSN
jgi:hypothetical protein